MRIEGSGAKGVPAIPLVRIGLHSPPPDSLISKTTRGPNNENSIKMTEVGSETEMRLSFIFKAVAANPLSSLSGISSAHRHRHRNMSHRATIIIVTVRISRTMMAQ